MSQKSGELLDDADTSTMISLNVSVFVDLTLLASLLSFLLSFSKRALAWIINGANRPPTASQKAKSPAKRKGKTDEEKVSRHGRPLRGLRPRASLSVDQIADPHDGFDLFVGG